MKYRVKRHAVTQPLDQSYRLIPLTQGQNAVVDADDFEWLSQWNWQAMRGQTTFYAVRKPDRDKDVILMHRIIFQCAKGQDIDHADNDGLNNRRKNLRYCTDLQNQQNKRGWAKSGLKGAYWHGEKRKWFSTITVNKETKYLGAFHSKEEAAKAYDKAAKEYFGEFAHLNFP